MFAEKYLLGAFLLPALVAKLDGETHGPVKVRHHRNLENRMDPHSRHGRQQANTSSKVEDNNVFLSSNNSWIPAHIGSTVSLNCQVKKDAEYGVITWARQEDRSRPYTLLTVGDSSYIEDVRYSIEKPIRHDVSTLTNRSHNPSAIPTNRNHYPSASQLIFVRKQSWNLRIKDVGLQDNGFFECQATTHPPQSIIVKLVVQEAYAEIMGTKEKVFKSESNLQLVCALKQATSKPDYIFWFHNERMINYDVHQGISVTENRNGSTLTIRGVSVGHSGNYTCSPSKMKADSVTVTILSESKPAQANQHANAAAASKSQFPPSRLNFVLPVTQLFFAALLKAVQDSLFGYASLV